MAAIAALGAEEVAARLAVGLTPGRRARIEAVLRARVGSLQVAIEATQDPHNAAAVIRTVEALGGGCVHVIAAGALLPRRITRGSLCWADTRARRLGFVRGCGAGGNAGRGGVRRCRDRGARAGARRPPLVPGVWQ
jgi:hypothetical protein